jgi:hypothetical protein
VLSNLPGPFHALMCIAGEFGRPLSPHALLTYTPCSRRTVECEQHGRRGLLVLSDGVFYRLKHLNPKVIVDITNPYTGMVWYSMGTVQNQTIHLNTGCACGAIVPGGLLTPCKYLPLPPLAQVLSYWQGTTLLFTATTCLRGT